MSEQEQESIQSIQPEPVPGVQTDKKPTRVILLVVLGLVIVVGAVYAGIQIGKKQISPSLIMQNTKPTSVPEANTPTPDETANWKTYRNEKFKFSFKYPTDLFLLENMHSQGEANQVFVKDGEKYLFNLEARKKYLPNEVIYYGDFTSNGEKTINGTVWKTFYLSAENCEGPTCPVPVFALQVEKNGILYSISNTNQKEFIEFQNQILSTFKFLE